MNNVLKIYFNVQNRFFNVEKIKWRIYNEQQFYTDNYV